MKSVYDDKVLREAIRSFMDAGRLATSAEMRLVCHGLANLAFSINELQKRIHFVEEKVGGSQMRGIPELLGAEMSE
jgi:cellulose synthase/poly-beta-1,6-N-acetylglucosamine synthase-like glycosyltransferase